MIILTRDILFKVFVVKQLEDVGFILVIFKCMIYFIFQSSFRVTAICETELTLFRSEDLLKKICLHTSEMFSMY